MVTHAHSYLVINASTVLRHASKFNMLFNGLQYRFLSLSCLVSHFSGIFFSLLTTLPFIYMNYELEDIVSKYDLCVCLKLYNPISVSENFHVQLIRFICVCLFFFSLILTNKLALKMVYFAL